MRSWTATLAMFASNACAFDSGGQGIGGSASIGSSAGGDTTGSRSDDTTAASEAGSAGPSSTAMVTTVVDESEGTSVGTTDPMTGSTTAVETTDSGVAPMELCNGIDDDGDGAIDEYSPENLSCAGCNYAVTGSAVVQSHCTTALSWPAALLHCESLGATLAVVHSAEVNDEVYAVSAGTLTWIGMTDAVLEDVWSWADGRIPDYTRWGRGQPNDLDDEDCAQMEQASPTWNDDDCENAWPYVCRE